jgi:hypothetical protein
MLEIIFDRSIFHREKFTKLKESKLLDCVKKNDVRVFFTPHFMEETLQFGLYRRTELKSQIEFLFALNPSHWFRSAEQIIESELGLRYVQWLYHLLTDEEISRSKFGIQEYVEGNISKSELDEMLKEVERNNDIREDFRRQRLELRKDVPPGQYDFNVHFENKVEWSIKEGLMKHHQDSSNYLRRWKSSRRECKFTEQYLRCWISTAFLAATNHTLRVDRNDKADATQLAYLIWADIMVSDDLRFMKEGFQLLYGGTGKRLFTHSEFLQFLQQLT